MLRFLLQPGAGAVPGLIATGFAIVITGISIDSALWKTVLFVLGGMLVVAGVAGAIALAAASGDLSVEVSTQGKWAILDVKNNGVLSVTKLSAEGFIYFGAPRVNERAYPIRWRGKTEAQTALGPNGGHDALDIAALSENKKFDFYTAQQLLTEGNTSDFFSRDEIESDGFVIQVQFTAEGGLKESLTKYYQLRMNDVPDRGFFEVNVSASPQEVRRAEDDIVPFILFDEISEDQAVKIRG